MSFLWTSAVWILSTELQATKWQCPIEGSEKALHSPHCAWWIHRLCVPVDTFSSQKAANQACKCKAIDLITFSNCLQQEDPCHWVQWSESLIKTFIIDSTVSKVCHLGCLCWWWDAERGCPPIKHCQWWIGPDDASLQSGWWCVHDWCNFSKSLPSCDVAEFFLFNWLWIQEPISRNVVANIFGETRTWGYHPCCCKERPIPCLCKWMKCHVGWKHVWCCVGVLKNLNSKFLIPNTNTHDSNS